MGFKIFFKIFGYIIAFMATLSFLHLAMLLESMSMPEIHSYPTDIPESDRKPYYQEQRWTENSMSPDLTHYDILEIPKCSPDRVIRAAHRRQAQRWHPDKVVESEKVKANEKMSQINMAYGFLMENNKRCKYDFEIGCGTKALVECFETRLNADTIALEERRREHREEREERRKMEKQRESRKVVPDHHGYADDLNIKDHKVMLAPFRVMRRIITWFVKVLIFW
ncbi:hypothetical protein F4781DRAFT_440306 [Annulohypoxylon bovei var. microspora]|nr:hypothetical protein F4781DRAFT_440306 [Annulohypoxylon bovei var. microspora]